MCRYVGKQVGKWVDRHVGRQVDRWAGLWVGRQVVSVGTKTRQVLEMKNTRKETIACPYAYACAYADA